jgi:hypothetical protein
MAKFFFRGLGLVIMVDRSIRLPRLLLDNFTTTLRISFFIRIALLYYISIYKALAYIFSYLRFPSY